MLSRQSSRPYTVRSFRMKLALFEQFIQEFTYVDEELNPEERQLILQARLTNGYEPFCDAIRKLFGNDVSTQDLKALFRKIALNPDAQVDWSELFGIGGSTDEVPDLLLNEDTSSVITTSKRRSVGEAGGDKKRRDVVQSIVQVPKYDFYIIASQKGIICQWSSKFRLQSCIDLNESSWVTGCGFLPSLRRIAVTSERALSLWDYRSKRKQLTIYQIKPMENSIQGMIYIPWKTESMNEDTILFGDDEGYVNMMTVSSKDLHMKNSIAGKTDSQIVTIEPSKLSYAIQRRKFHDDWVIKLKYFPQLEMFGSCSPSSSCSFILGSIERVLDNSPVRELAVPKGVNCFDYCTKANVIITAGADKVIRVWHPLIFTRPTGKLLGHLFTIVDIAVNEKDQQLISLSTARVFRVWDIQTLSCLQVFTDNEVRPGEKRISCMLFDAKHDRLITGCSVIDTWPLTRAIQDSLQVPHTHDRPICQLLYNPHMNQVISGCTEGIFKVWEMETGQFVYQVTDAHGPSTEITAMTIDGSGYRLATGAYNGSIKVWDFGSGQLYKKYPDEQTKKRHEDTITGLAYHTMYNKRCLLVSSWGNKIRVMEDPAEMATLIELKVLSDLFIPPVPSHIDKDEQSPFISRAPLPTIGETQEVKSINEEHVLSHCEVTCLEHVSPLLFAGTTSGAVLMWNLETEKIVLRCEPSRSRSANSSKHRRNHRDDQLVYRCLYLVHRVRKPIIYGKGNANVQVSSNEQESANAGEGSALQDEEQDRASDTEKGEKTVETNQEQMEDEYEKNKENIEDREDTEERENQDDNEDIQEEKEDIINEETLLGAFLQVSEPALVSSHQDGFLRFWNLSGTLLSEVRAITRRQASAVTSLCADPDCNFVISGDARGYITVWDVGNFLLDPPSEQNNGNHREDDQESNKEETKKEPKNVIKQVVCWRGHLTRVVGLEHVQSADVIVSASTDCSVRVWYRDTGHFIGFFSQPRLWHMPSVKSVPSTPVRPYDISEGPIKTLKNVATKAVHKTTDSGVDCPLMFDDTRWLPFRHSAQKETKPKGDNKKFFDSLSKPKHYNSHLETTSSASPETGAVYRALPVYRIETPERLKTPAINMQSSWLTNQAQNQKGHGNKSTFAYRSSSSTREPVVSRFPHIVQGHKR